MQKERRLFGFMLILTAGALNAFCPMLWAQAQNPRGRVADTFEEAYARLKPYKGVAGKGETPDTIYGHVFVGYQGWFAAEGDGSGRGWAHYGFGQIERNGKKHEVATVDLWPDLSDCDPDEKYDTPFRHKDGSVAQVFSSYNPKTVFRHFQWMRQYGIHGAFLQRFAVALQQPQSFDFLTAVMDNVRRGANENGVAWSVMYDLSGLKKGQADCVIEDWKRLNDLAKVRDDPFYQRHGGKPLVTLWGVGFNDNRQYTPDDCRKIIRFFKEDPVYGGNTVMVGVPTWWRTGTGDALPNDQVLDVILLADIIQPWTVGRVGDADGIPPFLARSMKDDLKFLKKRGKDYMPVAFPGFTWKNLMRTRAIAENRPIPQSQPIEREKGKFLWTFLSSQARMGAKCAYIAMFDEIDEGTAIMKCSDCPPASAQVRFCGVEDVPADTYLWLAGQGERLFSGKIRPSLRMPERKE